MIGKTIKGKYKIYDEVGEGTAGTVYLGRHQEEARVVAVKAIHSHLTKDGLFMERFQREASILAELKEFESPHIVKLYDFGEEDGMVYIVMEFAEGRTLAEILAARGTLEVDEALAVARQIAECLEVTSRKNIVHRDLRPANLMITPEGTVKVMDFGIARSLMCASLISSDILVTPYYIPPEQAEGRADLDCCTDMYSLGVCLYQMLTGELPYTGDSPIELILQHIEAPIPSVRDKRPGVPVSVDEIVRKCMAKKVEDRYATPSGLIEAIDQALRDEAAETVTKPSVPSKPSPPAFREDPAETSVAPVSRSASVVRRATPGAAAHPTKPRTRRSPVRSLRRRMHKRLSFVNRLVFYTLIVTLPFNLRISVPFVSDSLVLVSRVCLLIALALWLPTKLIEPRRRWFWGWWYVIIPLGLLLFLHAPQPFAETLLLVGLYLFVVNELPERTYAEVGLVFAIAVFAQAAVALWRPAGIALVGGVWDGTYRGGVSAALRQPARIALMDSARGAQFVAVEAFVPLGLALASRRWVRRSAGMVVAASVLATMLVAFLTPAAGLLITISLMLIVWMAVRLQRMWLQLVLLLMTLITAIGMALAAGATRPELVASVGDSLRAWQAGDWWVIVFLLALSPLAALAGVFLKGEVSSLFAGALPALFIVLLAVLNSAYSEVLNSLGVWLLWMGLALGVALAFTFVISLFGLEAGLSDDMPVVLSWLLFGGAAVLVFGIPLLILIWLLFGLGTGSVIFGSLAVSWMVGLAVALSLKANLNIGCGGLVLMVAAVVSSLAVVAQSPQVVREMWPLVVGVLVAISAWRSQRMWTVALSASLIGACLLALTDPEAWLTVPQSALFVTVMGLWVDKSNIPLEISLD